MADMRTNFVHQEMPPAYSPAPAPPQIPGATYPQAPPAQVIQHTQVVAASGGCVHCGGVLREEFTDCGIIWAICCFPWGLICLLNDRDLKCVNCGAVMIIATQ